MSLTPEEIQDDGVGLANRCDWNGDDILKICQAALTDANFHHEAAIIGEMIKALDEHDQPNFELIVTPSEE